MNNIVEEIKSKGKDNAVSSALYLLKEKQPSIAISLKDFEIKVLANSKAVIVQFKRLIRYIPLQTQNEDFIKYDIKVDLIQNTISPFNDLTENHFYTPTSSDLEAIAFVRKNFGILNPEFETTIHEEEKFYTIYLENKYSYGIYQINKISGKKESSIEGSYLPVSFSSEFDPFVELK